MKYIRRLSALLMTALLVALTGCAATAPEYQAANGNVRVLSASSAKLAVGDIGYGPKGAALNRLTVRGGAYKSPVGDSWAAYMRDALKSELQAANRLDNGAAATVSGVLLENELDGSGSNVGLAHISVNFLVNRNGATVYERKLTVDRKWESSFIGAIAIPAARQNYVAAVSELFGKLFADADFKRAIE